VAQNQRLGQFRIINTTFSCFGHFKSIATDDGRVLQKYSLRKLGVAPVFNEDKTFRPIFHPLLHLPAKGGGDADNMICRFGQLEGLFFSFQSEQGAFLVLQSY
jgi:hypothetical protein